MSELPQQGFVYKIGEEHWTVTRVEPGAFQTNVGDAWVDAIALLGPVGINGTRVMPLADFQAGVDDGAITLGDPESLLKPAPAPAPTAPPEPEPKAKKPAKKKESK